MRNGLPGESVGRSILKGTAVLEHSPLICVKRTKGKGRGVFARRFIARGTLIEKVPLLLVPISLIVGGLRNPQLARFFFLRDRKHLAVCLGYGSLYNHSYRPNARYEDGPGTTMLFKALRNIQAGEEICVNYNGTPRSRSPVGFRVL
jgi:SET domain-containing protein